MKKTTMLRKILKEPGLLIAPCAYDCLTARCAEAVGFRAVFMTGAGIRDTELGMPDIGIVTASEVVNIVRNMANSVNIPLILDADDGYGGALAAYRTTQELIRAGAAGMFIDDQKHPTKGAGKQEVLPMDEYLGKVGAVLEARNKEDKDFVIAARIDAEAIEEVLARAKACVKLGVDIILPYKIPPASAGNTKDVLRKLYKAIGAPNVLIWGHGPYEWDAKEYEDIGAKLWIPGATNLVTAKAVLEFYQKFHDTRACPKVLPPEGPIGEKLSKLSGLDFWTELEKKYVPK